MKATYRVARMVTLRRSTALAVSLAAVLLAACERGPALSRCDPEAPYVTALQDGRLSPPSSPAAGDFWQSPADGMILKYVPAGDFVMGAAEDDPYGTPDERPQHEVLLDAFWIDATEVTNAMYSLCVREGSCTTPAKDSSLSRKLYFPEPSCAGYPVVEVSWQQAYEYCQWAGRRLPTEAEWEKAARGTDGRMYPWGNEPPTGELANFCGTDCTNEANAPTVDDGFFDTSPVGAYPDGASPYGALDMAGNVWEWVADWGRADYYSSSPSANPLGPASGEARVARGGSFMSPPEGMRVTVRAFLSPDVSAGAFGGFRCAISAVP